MALESLGTLRLGFWATCLFAFSIYGTLHTFWEMEEFLLDKYAGTNLQPGGMAEATGNNLAGLAGALVGLGMLWLWRREGTLERCVADPVAPFLSQVKSPSQESGEPVP